MGFIKEIYNLYKNGRRYFKKVGAKTAVKELTNRYFRSASDIRAAKEILSSPDSALSADERELVEKVSAKIHVADAMYKFGNARHYFEVGLSAVRCIEKAIQFKKGHVPVDSLLDLPSGYGRVLRFLVLKYPKASITACDINSNAVKFCARAFKVKPAVAKKDFERFDLNETFSLIWCGSLIPHIAEHSTVSLLGFFARHLAENGLCVFTTLGNQSVESMQSMMETFGLSEPGREKVVKEFLARGYGYADYPNVRGLGISAVGPGRIRELAKSAGLKEVFFAEQGWGQLQDVYGYIRSS